MHLKIISEKQFDMVPFYRGWPLLNEVLLFTLIVLSCFKTYFSSIFPEKAWTEHKICELLT